MPSSTSPHDGAILGELVHDDLLAQLGGPRYRAETASGRRSFQHIDQAVLT